MPPDQQPPLATRPSSSRSSSICLYLSIFSLFPYNALSFSFARSSHPFTSFSFTNVSIFLQPPSSDNSVFTPAFKTLGSVFVCFAFRILTSFAYFSFTSPFYPFVFSIGEVHYTMRCSQPVCASYEGGLKSNLVQVLIEGESNKCIYDGNKCHMVNIIFFHLIICTKFHSTINSLIIVSIQTFRAIVWNG